MPHKQRIPKEKGQSLVELAISLPVIILILMGTFDFGMALFSYSIMRDAAQEGALYASFAPGNKSEIETRARNILVRQDDEVFSSPIDLRDKKAVQIEINIKGRECQGITKGIANHIEVRVIYKYPFFMPFVSRIIGSNTIQMTASASNVVLQPPCE
ncbi:hypothetical protein MASR2M66_33760 [Chloroflexota bacterium]